MSDDMSNDCQSSYRTYLQGTETENVGLPKVKIISDIKLQTTFQNSSSISYVNKKKKKKTICKFCLSEVTNFERHLERNHTDCRGVLEMLEYPKKSRERENIIALIRNDGHFSEYLKGNARPKYDFRVENKDYYPCSRCKALLTRTYLPRHQKTCILKDVSDKNSKSNQLPLSQTLIACSIDRNNTLHKLRVKEEVFSKMKVDEISLIAKTDYLIYNFGKNYLKKHKREQLATVCSNKMRELARYLIEFRKISHNSECTLKDIFRPKFFDMAVKCAWRLGGYDPEKKAYRSPSLSAHIGTSLKQVCELYVRLILKEHESLAVSNKEEILKDTKRFKELIETQWTTEISSLAFKDLQEKQWEKPVMLPLTRDLTKLRDYVTDDVANKAMVSLETDPNNKKEYKNLVHASLTLTILFNRKRIGDVQYTKLKTYVENNNAVTQDECMNALSESEKVLTKYYKTIVTGGKGSRAIAILFPSNLQKYIEFFIKIRFETNIVPQTNTYLFACPGTNKWTRADVIIRKFAEKANLEFPRQISSNKLRKQIATVMQILNLSKDETEQFAQFMGHTEKTHNEYYKLPQDIYQTAKISKLLLLMEKGVDNYKGRSLSEIDIYPHEAVAESDTDNENDDAIVDGRPKILSNFKVSDEPRREPDENFSNMRGRKRWNSEQASLVKNYFRSHIQQKKAPKKAECLQLINKYPDVLYNKDWVRIKTFVYNIYRKT